MNCKTISNLCFHYDGYIYRISTASLDKCSVVKFLFIQVNFFTKNSQKNYKLCVNVGLGLSQERKQLFKKLALIKFSIALKILSRLLEIAQIGMDSVRLNTKPKFLEKYCVITPSKTTKQFFFLKKQVKKYPQITSSPGFIFSFFTLKSELVLRNYVDRRMHFARAINRKVMWVNLHQPLYRRPLYGLAEHTNVHSLAVTMNLRKLFILYLRKNVKVLKKTGTAGQNHQHRSIRVYQCSNCTKKFGDLGVSLDGTCLSSCKKFLFLHNFKVNFLQNFFQHRNTCKTTSRSQIPCPICGKIVKTKSIQQHLKLHSNERDYLCPECGSSFSQKPGLYVNIRQAHQPSNTVHKCRFCGHVCRNQPQLWNHEWSHKNPQGITCDLCSKVFKAPNLLNNHKSNVHRKSHVKVEVNREDFCCPDCDHRFKSKQQLIRHSVKHSKEKPFVVSFLKNFGSFLKKFHKFFLLKKTVVSFV